MKKGRLGGFCSGVPDAPDAPVPLQTVPVACLSACHPAILSASLAETERQREEPKKEERKAEMSAVMSGWHGGNQRGTGAPS